MANQKLKSDKNKKIILAVLLLVMVIVAAYQLFLSEPAPRKRPQQASTPGPTPATQTSSPSPRSQQRASSRQTEQEYLQELLSDTSPLNLVALTRPSGSSQVGNRGNIFAYYVPPPPPPQPPPKPPPIDLQVIQPQTAVAGTPRPFTLTASGRQFPADAVIIIDGRPRQTRRANDTTLTTEIAPGDYASPRNMNVEVKSQSDPAKFWSKPIPFIVQPGPEPQFKYIGRIGDQAVLEMGGSREIVRMKRGDKIQGVWHLDAISDLAIELTHTQYEIKKRVPMKDKGRP
ncbi:MAG TPA: hypothetical protein VNO14_15630 [Blastocatellia bacterium]|nr:hypothetical protein [Blastocatellia bacterium]